MFAHVLYSGSHHLRAIDKATGGAIEFVRWCNTETNEVGVLDRFWMRSRVPVVVEEVLHPALGFRLVLASDRDTVLAESAPGAAVGSILPSVGEMYKQAGMQSSHEDDSGRVPFFGGDAVVGDGNP